MRFKKEEPSSPLFLRSFALLTLIVFASLSSLLIGCSGGSSSEPTEVKGPKTPPAAPQIDVEK